MYAKSLKKMYSVFHYRAAIWKDCKWVLIVSKKIVSKTDTLWRLPIEPLTFCLVHKVNINWMIYLRTLWLGQWSVHQCLVASHVRQHAPGLEHKRLRLSTLGQLPQGLGQIASLSLCCLCCARQLLALNTGTVTQGIHSTTGITTGSQVTIN